MRIGLLLIAVLCGAGGRARADDPLSLHADPQRLRFVAPEAAEQLVVWGQRPDARGTDFTRQVEYEVVPAGIVEVARSGQVTPIRDGTAEIRIRHGSLATAIAVVVEGASHPDPVSFRREIIPILCKAGCNSGGCHGKADGQNGFQLSIFGHDPQADHQALVAEAHGRRVFPPAPERSLLLRKATATTPHGGGRKIETGSRWHRLLLRWIAEGGRLDDDSQSPLTGIVVTPARITLDVNGSQQLRVVGMGSTGPTGCVTAECAFQSNNPGIADVDSSGRITATEVPGEAAILVRHQGHVAICEVTRPQPTSEFIRPAERNFIDGLVWNKLEQLGLGVSPLADDATFLRRTSLDVIGTLPTADEARAFLADSHADKRQRWVTALLDRPEYAAYWSQRWADLLQVDKDVLTPQGAVAFTRWIHKQHERNVPYDDFVRSILTAEGNTLAESPAGFFQVQKDAEKLARSISQLFLGVRIECAQCHHHPFERWDQQDYFALAGLFSGVERKTVPLGGLRIMDTVAADLKHPRTGESIPAVPLGVAPADWTATASRRRDFAIWATLPDNPYLARTFVNRMWAHYFGRGLVEPVDDIRATNPASNEPLLQALSQHFVSQRYDIKAFTRTLLDSRVYQLASRAEGTNAADEQNHSHAAWKPLPAEVLLDAVSQATGIPEQFNGWPAGYRAIQVWDNKLPSDFLEIFGRPPRQSVCACERSGEPSIAQALHLMNSTVTAAKIESRAGRAATLATSGFSDERIVEELYLSTLSRFPRDAERARIRPLFTEVGNRREAVEDILWSLLNTKEFVFNH